MDRFADWGTCAPFRSVYVVSDCTLRYPMEPQWKYVRDATTPSVGEPLPSLAGAVDDESGGMFHGKLGGCYRESYSHTAGDRRPTCSANGGRVFVVGAFNPSRVSTGTVVHPGSPPDHFSLGRTCAPCRA